MYNYAYNGGFIYGSVYNLLLFNLTFEQNYAVQGGGAMYIISS